MGRGRYHNGEHQIGRFFVLYRPWIGRHLNEFQLDDGGNDREIQMAWTQIGNYW